MKLKRLISLLLVVATIAGMLTVFGGLAVTATEITETDQQLLGYGYNVTAGKPLSRSSLVIAQPILDVNDPEILSSIYVMDLQETVYQNHIAESARELAQYIGSGYAGGINANIAVVNADISAMFDKSQMLQNAVSERYEIYTTEIARRQVILQMEVSELRRHLSARFERDIAALVTEEQAINFLNKYGTHLFTGYKLGGRMDITNYKVTNSSSIDLNQTVALKAQIGAAAVSASGGLSFSISEQFGSQENNSQQKSTYHCTAKGGVSVAGFTLDHLFTYNPSLADGKGNYMYQEWIDAINDGVNLDILDAANGAQAVPVWELLEHTAENSRVRGLLVRAYTKLCGDKYNEYNMKYPYLDREFGEESAGFVPTGTIIEYYASSKTAENSLMIKGPVEVKDGETYIAGNKSTLYMVADCEIKLGEKNWRVLRGAGNVVEIVDEVDGVFNVIGSAGSSFTLGLYSGDVELDSIVFNVKDSAFSGGLGTEEDPYLISTVSDLQTLLSQNNWYSKKYYYLMTNDIDAGSLRINGAMTINSCFRGVFDGGYYTISGYKNDTGNAYPTSAEFVGLFGRNEGTIKNLKVDDFKIEMTTSNQELRRYAGVLVGDNEGMISNCIVSNSEVTNKIEHMSKKDPKTIAWFYAGGMAGRNTGTIENSGVICCKKIHAEVKIGGDKDVGGVASAGGMVGVLMNDGKLYGCFVQFDVSDTDSRSNITAHVEGDGSTSEGYRAAGRAYVGGLVGWALKSGNASGCQLVDCVVDIPKEMHAYLKNCDPDGKSDISPDLITEQYAGSLVGKSAGGAIPNSADFLQRNLVLAVSSRAPTILPGTAQVKDGAGNETMPTYANGDTVSVLSGWGYSVLSSSQYFNSDIWTDDGNNNVINKAFVIESLKIDGYNREYEYNQHWTPTGITAQLITGLGGTTLKTYKINLGDFSATKVGAYTFMATSAGKTFSDTIKVSNTTIQAIIASDASTDTLYMGDAYSLDGRKVSVDALLSNGKKIALMVDGVIKEKLSYVNYPEAVFTLPEFSGNNPKTLKCGQNKILLAYGPYQCTFLVDAIEDLLKEITILKQPTDKTYMVGNSFSTDGMLVSATYQSGTVKNIANNDLELIGSTIAEGRNEVIVSYGNYITDTVEDVEGYFPLSVTKMPGKTDYHRGETIDWTGLELTYTEKTKNGLNKQTLTAADCTASANTVTAIGQNEVTLFYNGYSTKVELTGLENVSYLITFVGHNGAVISTQFYRGGEDVKAPTPPEVAGFDFVGWDRKVTSATDNAIYVATYEAKKNYLITFVGHNGAVISTKSYEEGQAVIEPAAPTIAGYTFTGWDKAVTAAYSNAIYTALYKSNQVEKVTYLITFVGHGGVVLSSQFYESGTTVKAPVAPNVEGYTFTGWDKTVATASENAVYTAKYTANPESKTYLITFVGHGGIVLSAQNYAAGAVVSAPTPPKVEGYTFTGWDKTVTTASENAVYTAKYTANPESKTYLITFVGYGGAVLNSQQYEAGATVTPPTPPKVEGYTFVGWDKAVTAANANAIYTANYTANPVPNSYLITFVGHGGAVLNSQQYEAGATVTPPTPPKVEGYTFVGWDKTVTAANANAVYTANYTANPVPNSYLITFVGHGGAVLNSQQYEAGATVTPPTPPKVEGYTFVGWDKAVTVANANAVYTANYTANPVPNSYLITFVGYGGAVLNSQQYEAGATVTPPTPPKVEGYTFAGWDKTVTVASANAVYTAKYTANPETKTYLITFVGYNGAVLNSQIYEAGQTINAPTPPKVEGFSFTGWDKQFTVAKADAVLFAVYVPNSTGNDQQTTPSCLVTFVGHGGAVLRSQLYQLGQTVLVPEAPKVEGYTFVGWDKEIVLASANTVYTAVYVANEPEIVPPTQDNNLLSKADMNGDGQITNDDVLLLLQRVHFSDIVVYATGDINGDGKVTTYDAFCLEKYLKDPTANPIG